MKRFQIFLLLGAVTSLACWLYLRKPYSPTDDIPAVAYKAFTVDQATPEEGAALATAARQLPGVVSTVYNPQSGLLALSFTATTTEPAVLRGLQAATDKTVQVKIFPQPAGAQCPVPLGFIQAFPTYLLGLGVGLSALFLLTLLTRFRIKSA